ncbi:hypothetical protein EST38_g6477 [Candolleomyces aberdarensis]|uniref:NADH-ubiquinone oxidoreductase n=1 Tax=Candolleomyces aberdarensis TaxID=2316362 RepID=A0A4Q2DJR7_9AGAR|nr:hypothetical protein EST38_g6477 [Candolleomyces aberdarensis]
MSVYQEGTTRKEALVDPTPLPTDLPKVDELGTTSAPLKSAAFFIGAYCKEYNEDFMLCKNENRDPAHCLKEGRRVTRCAQDLITKMRENCLEQFNQHWNCLEKNNQGLTKTIPGGGPQGKQVHEISNPIFKAMQK